MNDDMTCVKIRRKPLETIQKYAKIHSWSPAQFFDKLATILELGIDGLLELDSEALRKMHPYSDVVVVQDVRSLIGVGRDE